MKKNPCVCVLWHDAAYTDDKRVLNSVPPPRLTCGFVVKNKKDFINISVNNYYIKNNKILQPIDGFLIPKGSIVNFRRMDFYDKK